MNILIICGETSANIYGTKLAIALKNAGHTPYSVGDNKLAKASIQLLSLDTSLYSVNGSWSFTPTFLRSIKLILKKPPAVFDKAVIVDFSGYNFKVAKILQTHNIPIVTFITPNFWLWKNIKLANKLIKYSEQIITIFKKEFEFYEQFSNKKIVYLGHPLSLDISPGSTDHTEKLIGIFPGSRRSEISQHLPQMANIIHQFDDQSCFAIFCSNPVLHDLIRSILKTYNLEFIPIYIEDSTPLKYAITAPGTNTLKLALRQIPQTIIGQLSYWIYFFGKFILRIKLNYISLPNMIVNHMVCPEYVQSRSFSAIANEIKTILKSKEKQQEILTFYDAVKEEIQAPTDYYQKLVSVICKVP